MKLQSLALLFLSACAPLISTGQTQPAKNTERGFYMRFAAGYAIRESGMLQIDEIGIEGSETSNSSSSSISQKSVSLGQGVCLRLAGGYMFNKNIGVELGVHGVIPPTYVYSGTDGQYSHSEQSTKADGPFYIVPAFVFSTGSQWRVYGRAGLGLPLSQKVKQEAFSENYFAGTREEASRVLELQFKPAFEGSLGLSHPLNQHLSVQAELCLMSRNAYAKRSEITAYTLNGLDVLPLMSTYSKVTEYKKELTDDNSNPSQYEPAETLTFPVSFGSLGMNIGVTWSFK